MAYVRFSLPDIAHHTKLLSLIQPQDPRSPPPQAIPVPESAFLPALCFCLIKKIRLYGEPRTPEICLLSLWTFVKRDLSVAWSAFECWFLPFFNALYIAISFSSLCPCCTCPSCLWDGLKTIGGWCKPSLLCQGTSRIASCCQS